MKKCLNCSASLADDVKACPNCGSEEITEVVLGNGKKPMSIMKRIIITAVAFVLCFGAVGYLYFAKIVPSEPVEKSVMAIYEGDFQKHLENIPPDVRGSETELFKQNYKDEANFKTVSQAELKENYGDNFSAKVKVLETAKLADDALVRLKQEMRKYISSEIKDAAYVTVKITLSGDERDVVTAKTIISLKINGKWYAQNTLFGLTAAN